MATSSFRIERREAVAHFILCDSASRNALKRDFWMQFPKIVRDLDRDGEIRALILRGDGNHFSSGIDVSLLSAFVAEPGDRELGRSRANLRLMLLKMHEVFDALAKARFPSIAAVQGACLGGALDLATACDIRLATSDAYFSIQEIQMGWSPTLALFNVFRGSFRNRWLESWRILAVVSTPTELSSWDS